MNWNFENGQPIWQQVYSHLTQRIATGHYPLGGRIPSVRELATEAGINPNTMQRALAQLEADGLVITNRTAGRTVTEDGAILDTIARQLAESAMVTYLEHMKNLGFSPQQSVELLREREEIYDKSTNSLPKPE